MVKPRLARLALPGLAGRQFRAAWQERLGTCLQSQPVPPQQLDWETLVQLCMTTSLEVVGPEPRSRKRPHLIGHETENQQLDTTVSATLAHSGTFRHDPVPRTVSREVEYQEAVRASRQAAKRRKLTRQRWQWEWVENLTDELRTADHMGNLRRVYQIHRQLGIRRSLFQSSSAVPAPADPVNERAAWKEHFRILQAGRETVQETVWTNVKAEPLQDWLSAPPTDEEIFGLRK